MRLLFAAGLVLAAAGSAAAQTPYTFKPIDTSKYLVQPTDQAAGFLAGATQTLSRVAAGAIENSGYTKTINNVFGRKAKPGPTTQGGLGGLPAPGLYPSTRYTTPLRPAMPTSSQFRR